MTTNGVTHPAIAETLEYLEAEYHELLDGRCPRHPAGGPGCWNNATPEELNRLNAAINISDGNLTLLQALLSGATIPISKADRNWLSRHGRRK